jgi:hypothetical protein
MKSNTFRTSDGYTLYRVVAICEPGTVWVDNLDPDLVSEQWDDVDGAPVDNTGVPLDGEYLNMTAQLILWTPS